MEFLCSDVVNANGAVLSKSCGWSGTKWQIEPICGYDDRVEDQWCRGLIDDLPAGACPRCGQLVYAVDEPPQPTPLPWGYKLLIAVGCGALGGLVVKLLL